VTPIAAGDPEEVTRARLVQEQLGLKLQRGRKMMPVLVIDQIEPSEN
jgi:uncharacterized protein (TIGR03435 family)